MVATVAVGTIPPPVSIVSNRSDISPSQLEKAKLLLLNARLNDSRFKNEFDGIQTLLRDRNITVTQGKQFQCRVNGNDITITFPSLRNGSMSAISKLILRALFHAYWNSRSDKPGELNQRFSQMSGVITFPQEALIDDLYVTQMIDEALAEREPPPSEDTLAEREARDRQFADEVAAAKTAERPKSVEIDRSMMQGVSPYYPAHPKAAWNGFSEDLSTALKGGREGITQFLEKMINIYYTLLRKNDKQKSGEDTRDYIKRINSKIAEDLSQSIQYYFVNVAPNNIEQKSSILRAAAFISPNNLILNAKGFPVGEFTQALEKAKIDESLTDISAAESAAAIGIPQRNDVLRITGDSNRTASQLLGISDGRSSRSPLAGFLGVSSGAVDTVDLKKAVSEIEVNSGFFEVSDQYLVGSNLQDVGDAIIPENIGQAKSLFKLLPSKIFESLDTAYDRDRSKLIDPIPSGVSLQAGINEKQEYLKYLVTACSKSDSKLNTALRKISGNLDPSVFFITQVMKCYFENHLMLNADAEDIRKSYIAALDGLKSSPIFDQIHKVVSTFELQAKKDEDDENIVRIRKQVEKISQQRKDDRRFAVRALQETKRRTRPGVVTIYDVSFKPCAKEDTEVSANGFLRRLTQPGFLNDENRMLIDYDVPETKIEMIYLISGCIVLSPSIDINGDIRIFDPAQGIVEKPKAEILKMYSEAVRKLKIAFHPDSTHVDFKCQTNDGSIFAKDVTSLIGEISEFPVNLSGWKEGHFSSRFVSLASMSQEILNKRFGTGTVKGNAASGPLMGSSGELEALRDRVHALEQLVRLMAVVLLESIPKSPRRDELERAVKELKIPDRTGDTIALSASSDTVVLS